MSIWVSITTPLRKPGTGPVGSVAITNLCAHGSQVTISASPLGPQEVPGDLRSLELTQNQQPPLATATAWDTTNAGIGSADQERGGARKNPHPELS